MAGIMAVYWIDFAFQSTGSEASYTWRVPTILQCMFLVPMVFLVLIIPETPHWLASQDRNEEAHEVLKRMNKNIMNDEDIALVHAGIVDAVALNRSVAEESWKDLLKKDCTPLHCRTRKRYHCTDKSGRPSQPKTLFDRLQYSSISAARRNKCPDMLVVYLPENSNVTNTSV